MNIFFRNKLKIRGIYVITKGDNTGAFVVYIKERNIFDTHAFLLMPQPNETVFFTDEDVKNSLKNGTLKFVEQLPEAVYQVCLANFDHLKRKQIAK